MNLTDQYVRQNRPILESYYSEWHRKSVGWLKYVRGIYENVKIDPRLTGVFPPVARRIVFGLAQHVNVENRRVHCNPARNTQGRETTESQARSSERENAHRAAFSQDDKWALRSRRYPPGKAKMLEMLLFGLSAGVVLPNEMALKPKPIRRAGEGRLDFDRRTRLWEMRRATSPALPCHVPGILNLLIDPSGEWFIWNFRIPVEQAKAILTRWGKEIPGTATRERTVPWREAYSDQKRLVYCGEQLVYEGDGYGFLPLTTALPCKGEPLTYNIDLLSGESGPEYAYAGILAGCESVLDDIARKESQIALWIGRRTGPKTILVLPHGGELDVNWDPAKMEVTNDPDAKFLQVPQGELPMDVWRSVEHGHTYLDWMCQVDALQGYRQANSGYEQAIVGGLAGAVLKPYVDGLNLDATQVAECRNLYAYVSDLFPDGLELSATMGGQRVIGSLRRDDMDSLEVDVEHEFRLPQQRITEEAFWRDAHREKGASMRRYQEQGLGIEDPEAEQAQITAEDWLASPEVTAVKTRDIAQSYDAELAKEIEELRAASMEEITAAIQKNQGAAPPAMPGGEGLAPQGAGLPVSQPVRIIGQPSPAASPEQEVDLIARQAMRRRVPAGRR